MSTPLIPDAAALGRLGARLAALRLSLDLTQADVAEQAGVSKRTVERLESGGTATQLSTFLRVCRVLGLQGQLDQLVPEPAASPVAQLRRQRRPARKRASGQSDIATPGQHGKTAWDWAP